MPVSHQLFDKKDLIVYTFTGKVDFIELLYEMQFFYKEGLFESVIINLSEADIKGISTEEIKQLADYPERTHRNGDKNKTAVIATDDLSYGLARMFEMFGGLQHRHSFEVMVFRTLHDAEQWIEIELHASNNMASGS